MATYLFELGCEEIPARFMPGFIDTLNDETEKALKTFRLDYKKVDVLGTYRRLAIRINDLASKQSDLEETVQGPPARIAFDDKGNPLPPAKGFAKKMNVPESALKVNGDYVVATRFEKGQHSKDVLADMMLNVVGSMQLPIAMRWGTGEHVFFRPVHWILSLLDDKVIPIEFMGMTASKYTYGHRFLTNNTKKSDIASGEKVVVPHANDYEKTLKKVKVDVDQNKRKESILKKLGDTIDISSIDNALLDEVLYLVESPTIIKGEYDKKYLQLPDAILIECMKKHQKYFPVKVKGTLKPEFLLAAENVTSKNKATIIRGNQNVLTARLEDAKFFWEEDLKIPLKKQLPKLERVVFQKGLGTLSDKASRIKKLSLFITKKLGLDTYKASITKVAELCKADLVTQMVFEFPDLQGKIGGFYAAEQGEPDAVVHGISEHYHPRFAGDTVPTAPEGYVVAIADKIDSAVACFVNKQIPTGSQDPLAVRRNLYGVARIVFENKLDLDLLDVIDEAFKCFGKTTNREKLLSFFELRVNNFFSDIEWKNSKDKLEKYTYDDINAVLAINFTHINDAKRRLDMVTECDESDLKGVAEAAVRVKRLSQKLNKKVTVSDTLFEKDIEKKVWKKVVDLQTKKRVSVSDLTQLSVPLHTYFDDVLVMDKDPKIKNNRLSMLAEISDLYSQIADFEKIVV